VKIEGYDFNQGTDFKKILKSFGKTGFQAANFEKATEIINEMLKTRSFGEVRMIAEACQAVINAKTNTKYLITFIISWFVKRIKLIVFVAESPPSLF